MGMFEAGFVPGCAYLISCYYKRNEFLRRYAVFFSANMAAGAFNGLFSTLLQKLNGRAGLEAWQWFVTLNFIYVPADLKICSIAHGLPAGFLLWKLL